jgi:hypothetical protein
MYIGGLRSWWSWIRVPAGAEDFTLHYRVQTGFGAHPPFNPMGTGTSLLGGKASGA